MDLSQELTLQLKLAGFSKLLESTLSLDESLQQAAILTAQTLKTQGCSIFLLGELPQKKPTPDRLKFQICTHYDALSQTTDAAIASLNQEVAGYVAQTREALLIADLSLSPFASWLGSNSSKRQKSLIAAPILLENQAIGVIIVNSCRNRTSFKAIDLELLTVFAQSVSQLVHISQLQTILHSRFIEIAVLRDWEEQNKDLLNGSQSMTLTPAPIASDPNKLAKIVAKSFFKELTQAGFDASQIIAIATEVLSLLQNSLNKHKKRLARDEGEPDDQA